MASRQLTWLPVRLTTSPVILAILIHNLLREKGTSELNFCMHLYYGYLMTLGLSIHLLFQRVIEVQKVRREHELVKTLKVHRSRNKMKRLINTI